MTRPRTDQDDGRRDRREQSRRSPTAEGRPRTASGQALEKEDQADSGPDRDHAITRHTREA
ncbi:MAG TPA: hypothetical protein VFS23_04635 [Vicinamibacterales bacterium]|nr:hypothetical protein [Vicinamibacterales bacterium]